MDERGHRIERDRESTKVDFVFVVDEHRHFQINEQWTNTTLLSAWMRQARIYEMSFSLEMHLILSIHTVHTSPITRHLSCPMNSTYLKSKHSHLCWLGSGRCVDVDSAPCVCRIRRKFTLLSFAGSCNACVCVCAVLCARVRIVHNEWCIDRRWSI